MLGPPRSGAGVLLGDVASGLKCKDYPALSPSDQLDTSKAPQLRPAAGRAGWMFECADCSTF